MSRLGCTRLGFVLLAAALLGAACTDSSVPASSTSDPGGTVPPVETSIPDTTVAPEAESRPGFEPVGDCPVEDFEPEAQAEVTVLDEGGDGPKIEAVVYPRPDYEGRPWSQWGQGLVLPDGRFVSAIGDHLGPDGNSFLYEYDPTRGTMSRIGDVLSLVPHDDGEWGYGKIHAQMVAGPGCEVYLTTYWGSSRRIEYTANYQGDLLIRWDTASHGLSVVDVPVPRHGIPSLAAAVDEGLLYGEAVDPEQEDKAGSFFVYDPAAGETILVADGDHAGFRSILVDAQERAYFSAGGGRLRVFDPATGSVSAATAQLPGAWLRAATRPAADGTVYGATRHPDALFAMEPDGTIRQLGAARGYLASLVLSTDEERLYYVPEAHGHAWEQGTPIVSVDVETGEDEVLVALNEMAERELGLRLGGTYSMALDRATGRLFIGFNAGPAGEDSFGEVVLVIVHLEETSPLPESDSGEALGAAGACWSAPVAETGTGPIELVDSTADLGLIAPLTGMHGHAAGAGDVNGDGWTDLIVGTFADRPASAYSVRGATGPSPDRLLLGGPDGFTADHGFDVPAARTSGVALADLDNDGDLDAVLSRNVRNAAGGGTTLLENTGGRLENHSILDAGRGGRSIAVFDHDGDGLADLFLTEDRWTGGSSVLLHNEGGLRFSDGTAAAGLPRGVAGLGAGAADLDGDGWPDLFVAGSNRLFLSNGDGTFREADPAPPSWEVFGDEDDPAGVAFGDLDRDGRLDLVVGQHYNSTLDGGAPVPVRVYLNRGSVGGTLRLEDVTARSGLVGLPTKAPHVEVADIDNDGWPDIVTSASAGGGTVPAIFRNRGLDGGVPAFSAPEGLGAAQYWVSGAVTDFDRDGRLDLLMVEWEPSLPTLLFLNRSPSGHWLEVEIADGAGSPIGTVVRVYTSTSGGERTLLGTQEITSTAGYGGARPATAHFGLGDHQVVDVEIIAPHGGATSHLRDVVVDRHIAVGAGCG